MIRLTLLVNNNNKDIIPIKILYNSNYSNKYDSQRLSSKYKLREWILQISS